MFSQVLQENMNHAVFFLLRIELMNFNDTKEHFH